MSVALIPMANELGWSTAQRGFVSAAFFWGYAATQIPAGYICTKIGGAKVLLLGVAVWSLGKFCRNMQSCIETRPPLFPHLRTILHRTAQVMLCNRGHKVHHIFVSLWVFFRAALLNCTRH